MDSITVEATYGDTLADITLPTHENGTYEFEQLLTESVGNAGINEGNFTVTFIPSDNNYTEVTNIPVIIKVKKAIPKYEIPNNLEAGFNDTLEDVLLPAEFTWQNPKESVGNVGTNYHLATYTPTDTANYEIVKKIAVLGGKPDGVTKEINIVKWGVYDPMIDIRRWQGDIASKGISLKQEEAQKLLEALKIVLGEAEA